MKILINFFILFSFLSFKAQFFVQSFEGPQSSNSIIMSIGTNTDNIWQIGKPQKTLFASASSTPNVIVTDTINNYPVNNVSTFSFVVLNYNQFSSWPYALQWSQKLDMESKKDGGIVEFSMNSGVTWENVHNNPNIYQFYGFLPNSKDTINTNEYCFSGTDNNWRSIWLCIAPAAAALNDSIYFRFTFKSDNVQTNQEGWMMDNFNAHTTVMHPVKENSQIAKVVVYPNVTNGIINIEAKKNKSTDIIDKVTLFDLNGKIVEEFGPNYSKLVLDISKHKSGIYYINVTINKKTETHRIIYEKD